MGNAGHRGSQVLARWVLGREQEAYSLLPLNHSQRTGIEVMQGDYRISVALMSYALNVRPNVQDAYSLLRGQMGVATPTDVAAVAHVSGVMHTLRFIGLTHQPPR